MGTFCWLAGIPFPVAQFAQKKVGYYAVCSVCIIPGIAGERMRGSSLMVAIRPVLHTWGQTLFYHPHIHMLVPAGGLSEDGLEWVAAPKKFFVPVKALSAMFRGIPIRLIKEQWDKNELKLPGDFREFDFQV